MSYLDGITTGLPVGGGTRIIIAGIEKIGKTSLTCGAPGALLVPLEIGYQSVKIAKTQMLQKYDDVLKLMFEIFNAAKSGNFPFKSIVFDSATALERMIHNHVVSLCPSYNANTAKALTMESAHGGYGKAYIKANDIFNDFLNKCDVLAVQCGLNIVFTCHVFSAKIVDPMAGEYDSWDLLLHSPKNQKTYGKRELITQWADMIGFLHEPIFISKEGNVSKATSASGSGRMLALNRTPAYIAGNRFGYNGADILIPPIDGWNHMAHAIYQATGFDLYNRG